MYPARLLIIFVLSSLFNELQAMGALSYSTVGSLLLSAQYTPLNTGFNIQKETEKTHRQLLINRREAIPRILNPFRTPPKALVLVETPMQWESSDHPWRRGITASVFWVGEKISARNPTSNDQSVWDDHWETHFGGEDHPRDRKGYLPSHFTPKLNPFYVALPYNDLAPDGVHYPEAEEVIPWYWSAYKGSWSSVCKGRWIAIHYRNKICYAQWEDAGPFHTDDWQYVFKGRKPKSNPNGSVGIEISPAVRDHLGIRSGYRVSWKFVETPNVPTGPWRPHSQLKQTPPPALTSPPVIKP